MCFLPNFFYFHSFIVLIMRSSYLRWQETGRAEGISIEWESISLHAISNEPVKCIYIMLDVHIDYPPSQGNGRLNGNNDVDMANEHDEEDDDEGTCEGKTINSSYARLLLLILFFFRPKQMKSHE